MNSKVEDQEKPKVYQGNIIDLFIRRTLCKFCNLRYNIIKMMTYFSMIFVIFLMNFPILKRIDKAFMISYI